MRRRSKNSTTRRTSRMISGPMPSPGSTRTLRFAGRLSATASGPALRHAELPRAREPRLCFVGADFSTLLLGQTDIVEPVQQAMLTKCCDLEMHLLAVWPGDGLALQINRHHRVGALLGVFHQFVHDLLRQRDRQDAVLEAIIVEDVGKARRDDATYAEIEERPRRVLAARPAAEIVGADQHLGVAIGRLVEDEIGVLRPVGAKADLLEQPLRKP